jgi:hypothetical protein
MAFISVNAHNPALNLCKGFSCRDPLLYIIEDISRFSAVECSSMELSIPDGG